MIITACILLSLQALMQEQPEVEFRAMHDLLAFLTTAEAKELHQSYLKSAVFQYTAIRFIRVRQNYRIKQTVKKFVTFPGIRQAGKI